MAGRREGSVRQLLLLALLFFSGMPVLALLIVLLPFVQPGTLLTGRFLATLSTLLGVGGVAVWFGGNYIARRVARPLSDLQDMVSRVTGGDLTVTVPEEGYREARELGQAFNAMASSLRRIVGSVTEHAGGFSGTASRIDAIARESAAMAAREAASVAETTATIEELTYSFQSVARGAQHVQDIAADSLASAEAGVELARKAAIGVSGVAAGANGVSQAAEDLAEMASRIDEVTRLIKSVVEETKILALNAAIESARAGENGNGFAVVAREIRKLAESTGSSAGHISRVVADITAATRELKGIADSQADEVAASSQEVEGMVGVFGAILDRLEETARSAAEISAAARQQQSAAEQVVSAMQEVRNASAASADAVRGITEATHAIEEQASTLTGSMGGFRV